MRVCDIHMAAFIRGVLLGALLLYFAVTIYVFVIIPHTNKDVQHPPAVNNAIEEAKYNELLKVCIHSAWHF